MFISTGLLLTLLLAACGTLEIDIVSPTDDASILTELTPTPKAVTPTPPSQEEPATPTPHIDHWTVVAFPAFGLELEHPPGWEAQTGYDDPKTGTTHFGGVSGFVHVSALDGASLDAVVAAETGQMLQVELPADTRYVSGWIDPQ